MTSREREKRAETENEKDKERERERREREREGEREENDGREEEEEREKRTPPPPFPLPPPCVQVQNVSVRRFKTPPCVPANALRIAEQIVGIPVPHGRHGRLPGFLPGQGSTASAAEQIADIPSSSGDLQGFRPRQNSTATSSTLELLSERIAEQIVAPDFRGGLLSHLLLTLQLVLKSVQKRILLRFFALFPKLKKMRSWVRTRVLGCPPVSAHPRWRLSRAGPVVGVTHPAMQAEIEEARAEVRREREQRSKRTRKRKRKKKAPRSSSYSSRGALVVDIDSGMFLSGFLFRCFPLLLTTGQDARHHGRYGPGGHVYLGWFLSMAPCIWQSLVRCSPWFDSGYILRQFTVVSVGDAGNVPFSALCLVRLSPRR